MSEAREKASMRKRHLKLSIDDAMTFLSNSGKEKQYWNCVRDVYCDLYAYKNVLITFYFGKYEKRLKLCGLNIIKQTSKDGLTSTFSLFGIKLFKRAIGEDFVELVK